LVNLLWTGISIVVKRVKALSKGLFAVRAKIALTSIGHFAMFVGFGVTAEPKLSIGRVRLRDNAQGLALDLNHGSKSLYLSQNWDALRQEVLLGKPILSSKIGEFEQIAGQNENFCSSEVDVAKTAPI
jgi:hypothetical protein